MSNTPCKTGWLVVAVAVAAVMAAAPEAQATNGYFAHAHGAPAKGRAGAGTAFGNGPLAAATNPALGEKSGNVAGACTTLFMPDRDISVKGSMMAPPGDVKSENDAFLIACGGVNTRIDDASTLGILVTANGGMNTEYKPTLFGTGPSGVDLGQMFLGINYARKLNDQVTVGIMPMIAYQEFEAQGLQGFDNPMFSASPGAVTNRGTATSFGGGLKLGVLWETNDWLTLGASYQSRLYMSRFKEYEGLFAERGDFDIPAQVRVGAAFTVIPDWVFIVDYERIFYSDVAAVGNTGANAGLPGGCLPLGSDGGCGFGWSDMDVIRIGAEWKATDDLTLRAGYSWNSDFTKGNEALFNMLAPATIKHHASVGFSYAIDESWGLTGAYTRAFSQDLRGTDPTGGDIKLRMDQHEVSLGVSYRW